MWNVASNRFDNKMEQTATTPIHDANYTHCKFSADRMLDFIYLIVRVMLTVTNGVNKL
jgi:hypothetical protein